MNKEINIEIRHKSFESPKKTVINLENITLIKLPWRKYASCVGIVFKTFGYYYLWQLTDEQCGFDKFRNYEYKCNHEDKMLESLIKGDSKIFKGKVFVKYTESEYHKDLNQEIVLQKKAIELLAEALSIGFPIDKDNLIRIFTNKAKEIVKDE